MFEVVLANVWHKSLEKIVLVSRRGAISVGHVNHLSGSLGVPVLNVEVSNTTEGPASSVELGANLLDKGKPLVIANSDQYLDTNFDMFYDLLNRKNAEHQILVMEASDAKWSYVKLDEVGYVTEVREKRVISSLATVGIYGFADAASFLVGLQNMKKSDDRTNGEFYVAPVYNYLPDSIKSRVVPLGSLGAKVFGLGVPEDYLYFLQHGPLRAALEKTESVFGYAP